MDSMPPVSSPMRLPPLLILLCLFRSDGEFPLLWFGLFEQVKEITLQPDSEESGASMQWEPSVTPAEYHRCLREIRKFIAAGDTYQVNFTYRLRAKTDIDPWNIFSADCRGRRGAFCRVCGHGRVGHLQRLAGAFSEDRWRRDRVASHEGNGGKRVVVRG